MACIKQKKPTVSVCIPTYLGGATLGASIASVLAQSHTDFELIVLDDNSPDDTRDVVAQFHDSRLVYRRNEINLGPQGNWNQCLSVAQGTYFKLLPHDDLLHPDCLARQIGILESDRNNHLALVFSTRNILRPDGRFLMHRGYPGGREGVITSDSIMRACVRRGTNLIGEPGGVLFRKALADKVGFFDATNPYVIDLDYWFRLLAHGEAFYCAEPLVGFRISGRSWSVAIGMGQDIDFRHFLARIAKRDALPATTFDYVIGRLTPTLNNLARLLIYRIYLR